MFFWIQLNYRGFIPFLFKYNFPAFGPVPAAFKSCDDAAYFISSFLICKSLKPTLGVFLCPENDFYAGHRTLVYSCNLPRQTFGREQLVHVAPYFY